VKNICESEDHSCFNVQTVPLAVSAYPLRCVRVPVLKTTGLENVGDSTLTTTWASTACYNDEFALLPQVKLRRNMSLALSR
jgi:hypothetical protein